MFHNPAGIIFLAEESPPGEQPALKRSLKGDNNLGDIDTSFPLMLDNEIKLISYLQVFVESRYAKGNFGLGRRILIMLLSLDGSKPFFGHISGYILTG